MHTSYNYINTVLRTVDSPSDEYVVIDNIPSEKDTGTHLTVGPVNTRSLCSLHSGPVVQIHRRSVKVIEGHSIIGAVSVYLVDIGAFAGSDIRREVDW